MENIYHIPALLEETILGLNINPEGVYVDLTFGGGGHSRAILEKLNDGLLFGFDQDEDAMVNILTDSRFVFVRSNFKYLKRFLLYYDYPKVDGVLADLGVSFHHFDEDSRGFSFRFDSMLDMRMNKQAELSAIQVINDYPEEQLSNLLFMYGELRNSRKLAYAIVQARKLGKIKTTSRLMEIITPFAGPKQLQHKFFSQVFQAIRIEVNQEMQTLEEMLNQAVEALKPNGRICVLTYHSLEDRMVKNYFRSGSIDGKVEKDLFGNVTNRLKVINKKVIVPSEEEVRSNNRSRSAKLRIAEKI